jgi:outer membrane lipoprotein SlyB
MKPNRVLAVGATATLLGAAISGCSTGGDPYYGTAYNEPTVVGAPAMPAYVADYGTVDSIQMVRTGGSGVTGAIAGGVVGGLLGHQVGGGSGQTAATIAGAVGGAAIGNEIDRRNSAGTQYQIGVRLDSGNYLTIVQDANADLRIGDRVRVENGRVSRV